MKFIWFCAAGHSFFCGVVVFLMAIVFSLVAKKFWQRTLVYFTALSGLFLIVLSATPFSWFFYSVWGVCFLGWCVLFSLKKKPHKLLILFCLLVCLFTILAVVIELPYYLKPDISGQKFETLYIIGDSVSAGIGGHSEQTWPKLFDNYYGVNVVNLAEAGATVGSSLRRQAGKVKADEAMVLLEIGGNDFFAPTSYSEFERDLKKMIEKVSGNGRMVVMIEMPIFPWQIEYGKIQRKLAKQFNVILIPKRFFVNVLSEKDVSPDLAHLTAKGHDLMAKEMWSLIGQNLQSNFSN